MFHDGVNIDAEAARLATLYDFTPRFVFHVLPGFSASFSDEVREQLRCEPSVSYVEYDAVVQGID